MLPPLSLLSQYHKNVWIAVCYYGTWWSSAVSFCVIAIKPAVYVLLAMWLLCKETGTKGFLSISGTSTEYKMFICYMPQLAI